MSPMLVGCDRYDRWGPDNLARGHLNLFQRDIRIYQQRNLVCISPTPSYDELLYIWATLCTRNGNNTHQDATSAAVSTNARIINVPSTLGSNVEGIMT